ncbi:MAG: 2-oxoacid:acceptor oxidoreductase family protein [Firmicutes bacterium]|nr:2-oxoacid:acceptor oxidoreductase family protein [Bacillota bacterium]
MAKTEIRVGGLGGQGVILNASILGKAASIFEGKHATLIQAFGPEARGSACSAQVTISDEAIGYPYVKHPDVLVLMSQDAYRQFAPTLKPGGLLLYEEELVALDNQLPKDARALGIPATRFAEELGRRLVLNILMVGFFTGVTDVVSYEAVEKAVKDSVPKGTEDLNLRALKRGYDYGREQVQSAASKPAASKKK